MTSIFPGISTAQNLHPAFVHFPIALWITALFFWVFGMFRQREDVLVASRWVLYLGTISAALAVASGFWATDQMGHDSPGHGLIHVHRDFMLVATGLAIAGTVLAFLWRRSSSTAIRWTQLAFMTLTILVTALGADRGAELVFHYGIGTTCTVPPVTNAHGHDEGGHHHDETIDHGEPEPANHEAMIEHHRDSTSSASGHETGEHHDH